MHLQVGALARSTGLTVRTLHHYDEIGLLQPSGRSEAGYRMYSAADVARLHAIQALRHLGLPLAEIGPLLEDRSAAPERILEQQMLQLDQRIRQASELKERLALLRDNLRKGESPTMDDWVRSLAMMTTYGRHFSAGEIRSILKGFDGIEQDWRAMLVQVQACMDEGQPHDGERVQALARRWMALMFRWMGGDVRLLERWGAMFRQEKTAHGVGGAPTTEMVAYMDAAIALRVVWLRAHFGEVDYLAIRLVPEEEFAHIEQAGRKLLDTGRGGGTRAARTLRTRWVALVDQMAGGNPAVREKLLTLHQADPRLMAGATLSTRVREFLLQLPQGA